jgi:hypothetical protein
MILRLCESGSPSATRVLPEYVERVKARWRVGTLLVTVLVARGAACVLRW